MHGVEHYVKEVPFNLYAMSHKPHHRFTNPRLFDAFNGSATDTFLMILVPLFLTSKLVHCNVWSYMAFGSLYANWLTLIHAEYAHPWDPLFRKLGTSLSICRYMASYLSRIVVISASSVLSGALESPYLLLYSITPLA